MNEKRGSLLVVGVGAALVVGFFLPWIHLGPGATVSGWDIFHGQGVSLFTKLIVLLAPVGGAAMVVAGLAGGRPAATASLTTGAAILGYTFYKTAYTFIKITGIGLWLVLGGALVALIAGLAYRRR